MTCYGFSELDFYNSWSSFKLRLYVVRKAKMMWMWIIKIYFYSCIIQMIKYIELLQYESCCWRWINGLRVSFFKLYISLSSFGCTWKGAGIWIWEWLISTSFWGLSWNTTPRHPSPQKKKKKKPVLNFLKRKQPTDLIEHFKRAFFFFFLSLLISNIDMRRNLETHGAHRRVPYRITN